MAQTFTGLTDQEVNGLQKTYGPNLLEESTNFSIVNLAVKQFTSPLMIVLTIAFGLTLVAGDIVDAVVILLGLLVNAVLGFWQEYRAEKSLEALSKVLVKKATVIRGGKSRVIDVEKIVPGDLLQLMAGEKVAADGRLIEGELAVNEAILTGESVEVRKKLKDRVWAGTMVASGEAVVKVEATGMATSLGKIARTLGKTQESKTPLQIKLDEMGKLLTKIIGVIIGLLICLGWAKGIPVTEMVMVAVAVGVAAIPEGLAISLTAILTVGMRRILAKKALVRKLLAAEVLGSVTVICTDKTGTLTEGTMRVKEVLTTDEQLMVKASYWSCSGMDQLEVALRSWAEQVKLKKGINWAAEEKIIHRQPFSSDKKYSITMTTSEIFVLGAPEILIGMAAIPQRKKLEELSKLERWARRGSRVVGILQKPKGKRIKIEANLERESFNYVGLVILEDKVRSNLNRVMEEVAKAGIEVKVITGDFAETGQAVMRQIGMKVERDEAILGSELEGLDQVELERLVVRGKLFARINPQQKLLLVKALQQRGEVVAMTGDGVNDALALKQADVGIVVSTASEVARETADMVLLDDNFATIVAAVEEGRGIYKNLRKVVLYLLADSFTQILLVAGSLLAGLPMIITTVQVLWINLITDTLPSMALTVDPHLTGMLDKPPRRVGEPIIDGKMKVLIGVISTVVAAVVFGYFNFQLFWQRTTLELAQTSAFTLTALICILIVFSSRSMTTPIFRDKVLRNKWLLAAVVGGVGLQLLAVYGEGLQQLMGTVALEAEMWVVMIGLCVLMVGVVEAVKYGIWSRQRK